MKSFFAIALLAVAAQAETALEDVTCTMVRDAMKGEDKGETLAASYKITL
jgi:hypothetical protein